MSFFKRKNKYERWIPGWKATNAEMRMANTLDKILTQIERLPEEEQTEFIQVLREHLLDCL